MKAEYWDMIDLGLVPRGSVASQILPISCDIAMDHAVTDLRDFVLVKASVCPDASFGNAIEHALAKVMQTTGSLVERYYLLLAFHAFRGVRRTACASRFAFETEPVGPPDTVDRVGGRRRRTSAP